MALNREEVCVETFYCGPGAPISMRMTHVPSGAEVVDAGGDSRPYVARLKELWGRLEEEVARRQADSRP